MARAKVERYENFVDKRLKPDLVNAISMRDKVFGRQKVFSDLARNIRMLRQNGSQNLRTMVNLGSEVYVQAEVPDVSHIFVDIGLGFFVEFTLEEALSYVETKQVTLKKEIDSHTRNVATIKANIKLVLEGIRELMRIPA